MNKKIKLPFRLFLYGLVLAVIFISLVFGSNGSPAVKAQAAKIMTSQIYFPLVLKGYPLPQTLTVSKSGTGSGTVTSSPAGINCGATCFYDFYFDTVVTLTATASTGSTFSGWSGSGCSSTGTCVVTMDAARAVTAEFTINVYGLDITFAGSGSGTVTSSPPGINCSSSCAYPFAYGTHFVLTAMATFPSTFTGWSGAGCSGTGTCEVTMSAGRSVTANFDPTGGGIVNGGFENGSTGWEVYSEFGDLVIYSITDNPPYPPHSGSYQAWLGGIPGDGISRAISYVKQQVTVPTSAAYLGYWQWIDSVDSCNPDYDIAEIVINGSTVNQYNLCEALNSDGWVQTSVDLSSYAGQSVTLQILVKNDSSNDSSLYLDDISFQVSP